MFVSKRKNLFDALAVVYFYSGYDGTEIDLSAPVEDYFTSGAKYESFAVYCEFIDGALNSEPKMCFEAGEFFGSVRDYCVWYDRTLISALDRYDPISTRRWNVKRMLGSRRWLPLEKYIMPIVNKLCGANFQTALQYYKSQYRKAAAAGKAALRSEMSVGE